MAPGARRGRRRPAGPGRGPSLAPARPPARLGLIDFTAERQRHARFVGRDDALARLDEWLDGPRGPDWVVVTGGPGIGKSAILSAWLARREQAGGAVPHHFIRRQVADWDQPEVIAASLAAQIEAAFPEACDPDAKPERRLLELLGRVSRRLGGGRHLVLVVDGLDEARAEPGDNPLPRFLPHVLPAGIRLLCATRPVHPHLGWIEARSVRRLDLDDAAWAASNEAVVRALWTTVAAEYQPPLSPRTLDIAVARADGNALHAVMLHDALRDRTAAEARCDRIPRGLRGLIGEILDRAASFDSVRDGLGLLCAAQEALALDVLAELAGWSYLDGRLFVREARQLLREVPAATGGEGYQLRHDWVRELIAERLGAAAIRRHHRTLLDQLATWPLPGDAARRAYAVRHALAHRIAVADWDAVRDLGLNLGYLEARAHATDVFAVEQELVDAAMSCPDPALAHDLADLARALARESHWVRDDPAGTAGLVWNRLRRTSWTARDLARLDVPVDSAFLRVRHAASRESSSLERTLDDHASDVTGCAVTPDGRRLVSVSNDRSIKIWDLEPGRVVATLDGHALRVTGCAITPDGHRLVSASYDGTLKLWDLDAGRLIATLEGHADRVTACAVTPDGRRAVSVSHDGTLRLWDLDTGGALAALRGHTDRVTGCAVTPDGRHAISTSADRSVRIWDLATGAAVAVLSGHAGDATGCAVTRDGRRVISASVDRTLKIWELATGRLITALDGHGDAVRGCAVSPDGRAVASASADGTLRLWDLDTGEPLAILDGHVAAVNACAITPDGRRVISASADRTLKVWDLDGHRAFAAFHGHLGGVKACVPVPGGRAVSASRDGTLKLWDVTTGGVIATLRGHSDRVKGCAIAHDGRRLVSASADRTLRVWDLDGGRPLATLHGHVAGVNACLVTPDDRRVISASRDGTLKVWDLDGGELLTTLHGHAAGVNACAMTPDGARLISASTDGTLKIWCSGELLAILVGHQYWVSACAVTPDGRRVISASGDCTLKLWNLDTGELLATLDGHTAGVRACAVTPDGRRAISASDDRTLRIWDLATATCVVTHRGDAAFQCVVVSGDGPGDGVIAGDGAGTLWFLDLPLPGAWHPRPQALRRVTPRRKTPTRDDQSTRRRGSR